MEMQISRHCKWFLYQSVSSSQHFGSPHRSSGKLKHNQQRIKDISRNQHAIARGTISADTPIEQDGTRYAYIPQENDKVTGVLTLDDDTGSIDILLDDAVIAMSSDEPPQTILQDSTVFVRGFVNEDRVFASTYFTFTETEDGPAVDTPVEIQRTFLNKMFVQRLYF